MLFRSTSEKKLKQLQTGEKAYVTSFVAVAPVDDPQIAVVVILDEPTTYPISGGAQAAPVVRKIIEDTLPYLGIEPIYTDAELAVKDVLVPSVSGLTEQEAGKLLKSSGFTYRTVGTGEKVTAQMPSEGSAVPNSVEIVLYMGEEKPSKLVKMPDLTGMTYDRVKTTLKNINLYTSTGGIVSNQNHIVRKQSIEAGTLVEEGSVIIIELSDKSQSEAT